MPDIGGRTPFRPVPAEFNHWSYPIVSWMRAISGHCTNTATKHHWQLSNNNQTWQERTEANRNSNRTDRKSTRSQAVARIADRTASQHLRGHVTVTSSVTWPFDSPYAISYWWSFGTESLNPAVFEILRSKRIGVTSLTFQGHVTSSVTWPFDSPYAISYW